jgi:hypothetical protein
MLWEELIRRISPATIGTAFIASDGSILAKSKNFSAGAQELASWFAMFKDLSLCRQRGLSYGGKQMFVTEFDETLIVGRRDLNAVILMKSLNCIIAGVCDATTPLLPAYQSCKSVFDMLAK